MFVSVPVCGFFILKNWNGLSYLVQFVMIYFFLFWGILSIGISAFCLNKNNQSLSHNDQNKEGKIPVSSITFEVLYKALPIMASIHSLYLGFESAPKIILFLSSIGLFLHLIQRNISYLWLNFRRKDGLTARIFSTSKLLIAYFIPAFVASLVIYYFGVLSHRVVLFVF